MKKTWIKIKRGLLEPKHRDRLGIRIWLYLYILDKADWETGKVLEWRDAAAADELDMHVRTIRQQRQKLDEDDYITCEQKYHKQVITIHNYLNPRKYDEEPMNKHGDINLSPLPDGDNDGAYNGDNDGVIEFVTPSYRSHTTNHIDIKNVGGAGFYIFQLIGHDFKDCDSPTRKALDALIVRYGESKLCAYADYLVAEYPDIKIRALLKKINHGIDEFAFTIQEGEGYV